jgi:GT2 family glycosyltransferase
VKLPRPKPRYAWERRAAKSATRREVQELAERPLISIVLPTFDPPRRYLREAIESVRRQHYPRWELCIADDASTDRGVRRLLNQYAAADARIKADFSPENRGISAASNRALALCTGELVAFLDHDDALAPNALLRVAEAFAAQEIDVVYSDQDKITRGRRVDPFFKPDWSPVHALGVMYIGHLLAIRRSLAEQVGGFDSGFDAIQDFEFMLRVSERTSRIGHIPEILYHWRAIPGSIAAGEQEKSGVPELQAKAVTAHLRRRGVPAGAVPHRSIPHRAVLVPDPDTSPPRVSIVIVSNGGSEQLGRCLDRLFDLTQYPSFDVIVVEGAWNGGATAPEGHPVRRVPDENRTLNRARASNLGAQQASGEYLVFLAETTEVSQPDWIEQLVMYARLPNVGAVGPLLVNPDGRVEEAGLALGLEDPALPVMEGRPADGDGYYGSLSCAREVSAVSSECMLVPSALFDQVGGFKELYSTRYEDFDLCHELLRRRLSVIYVPSPRMISHQTSAAREASLDLLDRALFVDAWYEELAAGDPYFNPNFSPEDANYTLEANRDGVRRSLRSGRPLR